MLNRQSNTYSAMPIYHRAKSRCNLGMNRRQARLANLARLIEEAGSAAELARRSGASAAYLSQLVTQVETPKGTKRGVGDAIAERLERAMGKPAGWMDWPPSSDETVPATITARKVRDGSRQIVESAKHMANAEDLYSFAALDAATPLQEELQQDTIHVPLMEACGSMGPGVIAPEHDPIRGHISLSLAWVRRHFTISRPAALRFLIGYGDSMAPTFSDGDPLIVDTGITELKLDAVYVLARRSGAGEEELLIKRVQRRLDGAFEIISDNPQYRSEVIASPEEAGLRVVARVLGVWNLRKL